MFLFFTMFIYIHLLYPSSTCVATPLCIEVYLEHSQTAWLGSKWNFCSLFFQLCCWCFTFSCLDKPASDSQIFGQNSHLNEQFSLEGRFLIQVTISDSISLSFSNISESIIAETALRSSSSHFCCSVHF